MTMSWASIIMSGDAEERAVVTAAMNAIGQGITAGTQIVQYPASLAPLFKKGWSSNLGTAVAQLFVILIILYVSTKEGSRHKVATDADVGQHEVDSDSSRTDPTSGEKRASES